MDMISRQAAIDALYHYLPNKTMDECRAMLHDVPSAQPEPCEDAVNRADVVDMLEMFPFVEYSEYEAAREVVKRLPSAQPEQRWIACSKELPEKEGIYFIYMESGFVHSLHYAEGWNCYRNSDGIVDRDHEIQGVVAWQPLPEPYKET